MLIALVIEFSSQENIKMSRYSNTNKNESLNDAESLEDDAKLTVRVEINEVDAADILAQLGSDFPDVADVNEIQLIVKKKVRYFE